MRKQAAEGWHYLPSAFLPSCRRALASRPSDDGGVRRHAARRRGVVVRGEVGRLSRPGREEWGGRFARVAQSEEHHRAISGNRCGGRAACAPGRRSSTARSSRSTPEGRPSFQALHHATLDGLSIVYYAFDLLHLNGRDLTRARSTSAARRCARSSATPASCCRIRCRARRTDRRRRAAAGARRCRRQAAAVGVRGRPPQRRVDQGAVREASGIRDRRLQAERHELRFAAGRLLRRARLVCAGKVRSGFTPHLRAQVFEQIRGLRAARCPFANLPSGRSGHWGEGITADEMQLLRG